MDPKGQSQPTADFSAAQKIWKSAQVLYRSPAWNGEPEARHVLEEIARLPNAESLFWAELGNESSLVIAYCLLGLGLVGGSRLKELPDQLLDRKDKLTIREGSFSTVTDLGGLARHLKKSAKAAAP